jgi:hypothetical protein
MPTNRSDNLGRSPEGGRLWGGGACSVEGHFRCTPSLRNHPVRTIHLWVRGELWLPSTEGVQHNDTRYRHHDYTTAEGDPDVPDRTDEAVADHYTDTHPWATGSSSGGTTVHPQDNIKRRTMEQRDELASELAVGEAGQANLLQHESMPEAS